MGTVADPHPRPGERWRVPSGEVLTAEAVIKKLRKHIRNNGGHCG